MDKANSAKNSQNSAKGLNEIKINPKRNLVLKVETLKAFHYFQKEELVSRFNNYSKLETKRFLNDYQHDNFWKTMKSAMYAHNYELKTEDINLGICDEFSDGVYIPKEKQIILCANTLILRNDFENALNRHLIKLYDHLRTENYNFSS